ncbi:MAG: DUF1800 family protein [Bacteroidota bacterium]
MASLTPLTGTLGQQRAAHLLRRAGFGGTFAEINSFASKTIAQAVTDLLTFPSQPSPPTDSNSGQTFHGDGRVDPGMNEVISWFMYHAMDPTKPPTAYYKLVFFLHTCLTVNYNNISDNTMWYYHLQLLMQYADKSYKTLTRKMSVDNAMGRYLDIRNNTKTHPNENYARELLELFTVGKGPQIGPGNYTNYTEDDIRAAARVLTGWRQNHDYLNTSRQDPDTGFPIMYPDQNRHETSDKQFSSAFQNTIITGQNTNAGMATELDDLIDMIFNQDAVSEFICRKLYRYFVHYNITAEVENDIIQGLALTFRTNNFEFEPVLTQLFNSEHFYDEDDTSVGDETIGALIKNPIELWFGAQRFFKSYVPPLSSDLHGVQNSWLNWNMQRKLEDLGMEVFAPPTVAGYDPMYQGPDFNRNWASTNTLPFRYDYISENVLNRRNRTPLPYGTFNIVDYVEDPTNVPDFPGNDPIGNPGPHQGARIASHLVQCLTDYILPVQLAQDRFDFFLNDLLLDNLSPINWMFEWDNYINTGNDGNIKPQLLKLYRGLIQSPEFQLG